MVDSVITPSGNDQWTVYEKPSEKELGIVKDTAEGFLVLAGTNNMLTGILLGPYASKGQAMAAIAYKLGGTCSVGV